MKFCVDKIEDDIVVLENIETNEITEINKDKFLFEIKENDILTFNGTFYLKDESTKEERIRRIKEKMNKLKR